MTGRLLLVGTLAAAMAMAAAPLHAQGSDTLRVEERVRLTVFGDPQRLTGTLLRRQGDTLVLRDAQGRTQRLRLPAIERGERSLGRRAGWGARRGALWGALAGGGVLALGGAHGMSAGEMAAGTLLWSAMGAVTGALRRPEQWRVAALPRPSPVAPAGMPAAAEPVAPPARTERTPGTTVPPQPLPGVAPRDLVRFATDTLGRVSGAVISATSEALVVDRGGIALHFATTEVRDLQVYLGKTVHGGERRAGKVGAVVGGVLGGVVGAALGLMTPERNGRTLAGGVLAMGAAGGFTGYFLAAPVGRAFPADEWQRVRLPPSH
jgi:hypothetical protein